MCRSGYHRPKQSSTKNERATEQDLGGVSAGAGARMYAGMVGPLFVCPTTRLENAGRAAEHVRGYHDGKNRTDRRQRNMDS